MNIEKEEWRDIAGYEGKYQVSNLGRVKSLKRIHNVFRGRKYETKERILSPYSNCSKRQKEKKKGYLTVSFYAKNSVRNKKCFVHRLVAMAFIPNPDNLPCINHKDEDITNNRTDNLEWCTYAYNNAYGTAKERAQLTRQKKGMCKKVIKYTLDGKFVAEYESIREAARENGVTKTGISHSCHRKIKTSGGFIYRFADIY